MNIMDTIAEINSKIPIDDANMIDGMPHCKRCGEPLILVVNNPKIGEVKCHRNCACRRKDFQRGKERKDLIDKETRRHKCFSSLDNTRLIDATFENDMQYNADASRVCKGYAESFEDALHGDEYERGSGLILFGGVGTGKSYLAACVANRVVDKGYTALYVTTADLAMRMTESFDARKKIIEECSLPSLLVLDDLGSERNTESAHEMIFAVVNARYKARKPIIITTNMSREEMTRPQTIQMARIFDRILDGDGGCLPIRVDGTSRRREAFKRKYETKLEKYRGETR